MKECHQFAAGTLDRCFMDKTATVFTGLADLGHNVVSFIGHMVNAFPVLVKELGNGTIL